MLPWQRAAQARAGVDSDESTVMDCDIEIYHHTVDQTQTAMAQDLTGACCEKRMREENEDMGDHLVAYSLTTERRSRHLCRG